MARLHVAQIAYLSQQLIEQVNLTNNLITRGKVELDSIHQTIKTLMMVFDEFEKDEAYEQGGRMSE